MKQPLPILTILLVILGAAFHLSRDSRQWVGGIGYWIQYRLGRTPEFIFRGERERYQRFYIREEIPLQFANPTEEISWIPQHLIPWIKHLESGGLEVVILPVPTKLSIERKRVPAHLPNSDVENENPRGRYARILEALEGHGVDLFSEYESVVAQVPPVDLYVPTDTHWTSRGIALAARALLNRLRATGWKLPSYELVQRDTRRPDPAWDLFSPFVFPDWVIQRPEFAWREPLFTLTPTKPIVNGPRVILAGSCYSNRLKGLDYSLSNLLGSSLGRVSLEVTVPLGTAIDSLYVMHREKWVFQKGDLLVIELTMRHPFSSNTAPPRLFLEGDRDIAGEEH